jgi:hypothetical protein
LRRDPRRDGFVERGSLVARVSGSSSRERSPVGFAELEADDNAGGEALRMAGDTALGDAAAAVTVVGDAPVDMRENGGVDATDPTVVAAGGVFGSPGLGAVRGKATEDFEVGLEGEDGKSECDARAEEAAVHVAGEVTAGVCGDGNGTKVGQPVVKTEGSGGGPALIVDLSFFATDGSVDGELGLGVKVCGEEKDDDEGEDL